MKLVLASISSREARRKEGTSDSLVHDYVKRASRLCPTEIQRFRDERELLAAAERQPGRPAGLLMLLDSRGEMLSSEGLAATMGRWRDDGVQKVIFGIGPADGWSAVAVGRADRRMSLGPMTLPHELARVVLAEQVYRALTILAGHPYHLGH